MSDIQDTPIEHRLKFRWGELDDLEFSANLHSIYEKIVYWRKNVFLLPKGAAGKKFITETTRLLNAWCQESPLKNIAFKVVMIMPALLLQKPNKKSKSKDHRVALERRLVLWENGNILELYNEGRAIQERLRTINNSDQNIGQISKKFAQLMQKGNIHGAMRLLTRNMQNGLLPLNNQTINLLAQKHPDPTPASQDVLLQGPIRNTHSVIYDEMEDGMIIQAASRTKGGSGPSGMDADGWRHILCSTSYGTAGTDLCKAFASVIRKLCTDKIQNSEIEAFLACRLIPLDKKPGLRPIGVGEVMRRIASKVVMSLVKQDVVSTSGSLQTCAGQVAGCEASIHAMHDIFKEDQIEAVILVDASNAFNSVNREAFLHNIKLSCPIIATYAHNCYSKHIRLFVIGGKEILSKEGTTQGDPIAMAIYALALAPLITTLSDNNEQENGPKLVTYADDITVAGKLSHLRKWWNTLEEIGPKYGYYPQAIKSWIIAKTGLGVQAKKHFDGINIQINETGQRLLGAVIGSEVYKTSYTEKLVDDWIQQVTTLSEIAKTQPQAAYTAYTTGMKQKFNYYLRTIPDIENLLFPLEDVVRTKLIPALTGGIICSDDERALLALPARFGGMGIAIVSETATTEYKNSRDLTKQHQKLIIDQKQLFNIDSDMAKSIKNKIHADRKNQNENNLAEIRARMTECQKRLNEANQEKGASNWLTSIPLKELDYALNKGEFMDAIRMRYGWVIENLPSKCVCGEYFNTQHAISCKKGGFITLRHNHLRDMTASLLKEVCKDVALEPLLQPLTGESFQKKSTNTAQEARLDVSARGFWVAGQRAFFDIRVFDSNAIRYRNLDLKKCHEKNEAEKKLHYSSRILEVENGTFTPLVFSATGGLAPECRLFYKRLAILIAEKNKSSYSITKSWIQTKISFSLMRSILLCIRGSRSPYYKSPASCDDMEVDETRRKFSEHS